MIIVGINRSVHDGSIALLKDNEVIFSIHAERLSNIKYDPSVFQAISLIKNYVDHVDYVVLSGTTPAVTQKQFGHEIDYYSSSILALDKSFFLHGFQTFDLGHMHHEMHASTAFYNSGFDTALCIVKDGAGSMLSLFPGDLSAESSSAFTMSYPDTVQLVEKHLTTSSIFDDLVIEINKDVFLTRTVSEGGAFEITAEALGFTLHDAGKIMGMSSYGYDDNKNINIYKNGLINNDLFLVDRRNSINDSRLTVKIGEDFQSKANFAYKLQKEMQDSVADYVLNLLEKTQQKNLCLSGGLFLNCVSNYNLLKRLPKDVNVYVEPMSNDAGNAIGAAKFIYHKLSQDKTIKRQTNIYYGAKYNYTVDDLKNEKIIKDVTPSQVAKLISEKNIVALYQGRSECGPRALGNRSILYDPRDPNGKDHVNIVKKREWFRPFAGTVLYENAKEWFDLQSLDESKFMMFAVDVLKDKQSLIPAITHVDGTCRIQTLKKEDNENYYNLINEFYKITNVPILFNTSLNLAGDAINETLEDALNTLHNSEINYLYLPELNVLVTK
jgi:carbamoyltransferase